MEQSVRQTRPVSIEIICHFLLNNSSLVCRRLGLYLQTQIKLSQAHGFSRLEKKKPGYERFFLTAIFFLVSFWLS